MKILVGLSNGLRDDIEPYQMLVVDVDSMEPNKQEWEDLSVVTLSSCANVRVNLGNYKSVLQNPEEYLEAEFDVGKIINASVNNKEYQIIGVYGEDGEDDGIPVLYRTVNSSGDVEMHHISEFPYKKKFSIYGENFNELPSYVKPLKLKDAYDWWKKKDNAKIKKRTTRFVYENFDTCENMPVQLLYHYLVGVKGFQLGYHTITDLFDKNSDVEKLHEYFLFNGTANVKLREILPEVLLDTVPVALYGNKDPYPDKRKLGYFGAMMSLICNRKNYPTFDVYSRPTSEANFDRDGIEVTIDITDCGMGIYNKYEEAKCISNDWRLGEKMNFFGVTLASLLPEKMTKLSRQLQDEKEREEYGHWSSHNTNDWFQVMGFAVCSQYYSKELRNKLGEILRDFQLTFSSRLAEMIERISAKDSLETMKWAEENVEKALLDIVYVREDETIQNSNVNMDQMKNLFTFKRNSLDLPDWLQIYSPETIEKLGGVDYLNQFISTRGEDSAELFLSIWAEKLEGDQRYTIEEPQDDMFFQTNGEMLVDSLDEPVDFANISNDKTKQTIKNIA